jgi:rhodanese-related sulfurtransferase
VGALISDLNTPIIYVADEGKEEEVVTRLARVGYDHSLGYLKGGMNSWTNEGFEVSSLEQISAPDFADRFETEKLNLVDVRKKSEYDSEHLLNAENYPLDFIFSELSAFSSEKTYYIHCAGGYRSAIACSILSSKGFKNVINITGGFTELSKTGLGKSEYVCPSTML